MVEKIELDEGLTFDFEQQALVRGATVTRLDKKSADLLRYFVEHPGRLISREELISHVWHNQVVSNDAINRAISVLRKALGGSKDKYIVTVPKAGYRFCFYPPEQAVTNSKLANNPSSVQVQDSMSPALQNSQWSKSVSGGPVGWAAAACLVLLLVFVVAGMSGFGLSSDVADKKSVSQKNAVSVVVFPLQNISADSGDRHFVAGLSDELVNNLARKERLLLLAPSAGAQELAEDGLKKQAEDLGADYFLSGNVQRQESQVKVAIQLASTSSGEIVFSEIFQEEMQDYFSMQSHISKQIAAALNVTISYPGTEISQLKETKLSGLDYLAIEKLIKARAKVNEYQESSIRTAIEELSHLNAAYRNRPQILGLLAYARFSLESAVNSNADNFLTETIQLAESALALDPTNFDALLTLANIYLGFPDWRERGKKILGDLHRYYPGNVSVYHGMLQYFGLLNPSCKQITQYIDFLPAGVFSEEQVSALNYLVRICRNGSDQDAPWQGSEDVINWAQYVLYLPGDALYGATWRLAKQQPNTRMLAELYTYHLMAGAKESAQVTKMAIDSEQAGAWTFISDTVAYLYDDVPARKPSEQFDFVWQNYRNATLSGYVSALIKQARTENRPELLKEFLSKVPEFPVTMFNRGESVGYAGLLHYAGEQKQARQVATQLLDELLDLYGREPNAYKLWNMAPITMACAILSEDWPLAEKVLSEHFGPNYAYWFLGYEASKAMFADWTHVPAVQDYLQRIADDRQRIQTLDVSTL